MSRIEVLLGGQGGQGVRLAATLLGRACALLGRQAASSATYGPEVRGALIRSEVVISDAPITYPRTLRPNYLVVMAQMAYDRLLQDVADDALVLFDPEAVTPSSQVSQPHCAIPAMKTATEVGHPEAGNMVMLGALSALSGQVDVETLKKALPASFREGNEAALERGFALAGQCFPK